jgi:hypothetical protein
MKRLIVERIRLYSSTVSLVLACQCVASNPMDASRDLVASREPFQPAINGFCNMQEGTLLWKRTSTMHAEWTGRTTL